MSHKYGNPPYNVVVVHGGPGAPGEMKPVAIELSKDFGVLEPLQTKDSVEDQIEELKKVIEENADFPVILIGWSWGAWLAYLVTAQYPNLVKKLILVSSGPFKAEYAEGIMKTRLERLSEQERKRVEEIMQLLQKGKTDDKTFGEFGKLMDKADSYDLILKTENTEESVFQPEIYQKVWPEADELRKTGKLLEYGKSITCPVIAIHGDYDPHPAEGVNVPLSKVLKNFKFFLLKNCGHHPWFEKEAKDAFYKLLAYQISWCRRD